MVSFIVVHGFKLIGCIKPQSNPPRPAAASSAVRPKSINAPFPFKHLPVVHLGNFRQTHSSFHHAQPAEAAGGDEPSGGGEEEEGDYEEANDTAPAQTMGAKGAGDAPAGEGGTRRLLRSSLLLRPEA